MSRKLTLAEFCKNRGITPEWLASKDGNLEIDSRTRMLPDDELIVGGYLMIKSCAFPKFPGRVVVGGNLTIDHCDLEDLPNQIEVYGSVFVSFSSFKRIHEGCTFHQSICFDHCQLREIADFTHVHGFLRLDHCIIDTLPKGLVVDDNLYIRSTNMQSIPADCRCKALIASYSRLTKLPDNWSVEGLNLTGCPITELPKGLRNLKYLNIAYTHIREIREVYPGIVLHADYSQLTKLPDNWSVEGLNLTGCPITELPKGLRNLKYLNIANTRIREITEVYPGVVLEADYSRLAKLPDNWHAKSVSVAGCPIEVLPKGMIVTTDLNIFETCIKTIPCDCKVGRHILASHSKLKFVPDGLVIAGCLDVFGTDVTVIPSHVICSLILYDAGVQVDAYQFNRRSEAIDFHPNGQYVCCNGILSKILEHEGNVWRCMDLSVDKELFVVTDGVGHYAHGSTIQQAEGVLRFKFGHRTSPGIRH